MIPLYGFLAGDTIGLLVFANASETVEQVALRLERSAGVHAHARGDVRVLFRGRDVPLEATVKESGLRPLERFDVVGVLADASGDFPFEEDAPFDRYDVPEAPEFPEEIA